MPLAETILLDRLGFPPVKGSLRYPACGEEVWGGAQVVRQEHLTLRPGNEPVSKKSAVGSISDYPEQ
jgi:hypothetical protein